MVRFAQKLSKSLKTKTKNDLFQNENSGKANRIMVLAEMSFGSPDFHGESKLPGVVNWTRPWPRSTEGDTRLPVFSGSETQMAKSRETETVKPLARRLRL